MRVHVLLGYATAAAGIACLGLVFAARALGSDDPVRLFPGTRPNADARKLVLWNLARKLGAIAVLLMLATKCAGSR